jgi:alpha-L-rhamnosidase
MLEADYDDGAWQTVIAAPTPDSRYLLSDCPRDRVVEVLTPTLLYRDGDGALYDAGVTLSGYPVIRGRAGRITVRVSEILDADGRLAEFYGHKQYLDYTVGKEPRLLYPRFCWLGFRYFYVTGDCEVVAVHKTHADVAVTSAFDSVKIRPFWSKTT